MRGTWSHAFPAATLLLVPRAAWTQGVYGGRGGGLGPAGRYGPSAPKLPGVELAGKFGRDRKSTRLNSSHVSISYAVFCLKKKTLAHDRDGKPPRCHRHHQASGKRGHARQIR